MSQSVDLAAAARQAMLENGFIPDFSLEVRHEAAGLTEPHFPEDAPPRLRDLRDLLWSSIDNRESRDLDQVEVAERLPDGAVRLRIGIADVDVLVPKGSAIDDRAATNTTSVYAAVTVFHMLPERLSTDLTSLTEEEERLAVVIEMEVGPGGIVRREDVYRAVLRNRAKLVYEEVGAWLAGTGPLPRKVASTSGLEAQLRLQDEVARLLTEERRRNGALALETIEPRAVVAHGKVIDVAVVPRNRGRDLIESFMVAANSAMARWLQDRRVPAIRRIVRSPQKWKRLVALADDMGESLPDEPDREALADFLDRRRQRDPTHFPDLSLAVVKLLGAGEYVLERRFDGRAGEGHFGLAAAEYAHSTAPNRRFADLVTQRLMKFADGQAPRPYEDDELLSIAARCTRQEDAARKVERSVRKKAAAAFMRDRVGERFLAVVTGASPKGTYVRVIAPPVEGRVVRGERSLDVGDTVRVTLLSADPETGFIDFAAPPDVDRKLERMRRKRRAAARLIQRVGERFDAIITSATERGVYARIPSEEIEGRVVRGHHGLVAGQRVTVTLVDADTVHGFIDFEYATGVEPRKLERAARKRRAAGQLADRIGDVFDAEITGVTPHATWLRIVEPPAEGRLVRGMRGLSVGDRVRVALLAADAEKGWIDFALASE